MKKIGIIGHFGAKKVFLDGQTVKTKNLKMLLEQYGGFDTYCVDTYLTNVSKVELLIRSILCLIKCSDIIILLGENGMRFYLPFLYFTNKLFRRKIYHYVIGSELVGMVEKDRNLVKWLNGITKNWFEYESGSAILRQMGVKNVETLPNCKMLDYLPRADIKPYVLNNDIYSFCTFSRVMEEKGITDAILAIAGINKSHSKKLVHLDVYGQVDETYREKFEKLLLEHGECVSYKGLVDSQKSVDVLRVYYALLFPTRWPGEGFPGAILDCYASALPIIATDWNANGEIIHHGKTGIIYPKEELCDLRQAIEWSIKNDAAVNAMRFACREEYEKYTPEHIAAIICAELSK